MKPHATDHFVSGSQCPRERNVVALFVCCVVLAAAVGWSQKLFRGWRVGDIRRVLESGSVSPDAPQLHYLWTFYSLSIAW